MTLFQILLKEQAPTNFKKSEECSFYNLNVNTLLEHKPLAYLAKKTDDFGIIRANIILRAMLDTKENEIDVFKKENDKYIDPFDYYGFALYESKYSNLLTIDKCDDSVAMYDENSQSIYIINDQGRLDNVIALFDKRLKKPNKDDIVNRLKKVVKAYFDNNREEMLAALYEERFISEKLYKSLVEDKR